MKKSEQSNVVSITSATSTRKPRTKKQTDEERFRANLGKPTETGCLLWPKESCFSNGYGRFNADGTVYYAHRYSYQLTYGSIPEGKYVLHGPCDNPRCVAIAHLRLGDAKMNAADRESRNRGTKGRSVTRKKFTPEEIDRVVRMAADGATQYRIARTLGRTEPTLARVLKREASAIAAAKHANQLRASLRSALQTAHSVLDTAIADLQPLAYPEAA